MEAYESQEHEIARMARNHHVSEADLAEYIEKTNKNIQFMFPDQTSQWIRWRVERETWNNFFKKDKFPGRMPNTLVNTLSRNNGDESLKRKDENRLPPRPTSSMAEPWVHDLFNPSPAPPRQRETDSYKLPSSPVRSREVDSYKPPTSSLYRTKDIDSYRPESTSKSSYVSIPQTTTSQRPASTVAISRTSTPQLFASLKTFPVATTLRTSIPQSTIPRAPSVAITHYVTQDEVMRKAIIDKGNSEEEYSEVHRRFTKEVNCRHSVRHVTPQWLLWRKEASVWYHFLPRCPFPGQEPIMAIAAPVDNYQSRWRSFENKAALEQIPLSIIELYLKEQLKHAESQYGFESKAWRVWFSESTTWAHFFGAIKFHGIEPKRRQDAPASVISTTAPSAFAPSISASQITRHPRIPPKVKPREVAISTVYQGHESVMERKALAQGIRREFFQYLQQSRDWARENHSDCTKDVRNYLADNKTWQKYFGNEQFPGIKPFGGHTPECIKKTLQLSQGISRSEPRFGKISLPRRESSSSTPGTSITARAKLPPSQPGQATIAFINITYEIVDPKLPVGRATKTGVTTLTVDKVLATQVRVAFERDDARKIHELENRLKCRLEGVQSLEGSLTIKLKPFCSSDAVAFEVVFRFIVSWVEACVRGTLMSLSSYENSFTLGHGVKDAGLLTTHALSSPTSLLVNGKYIPLDHTEFDRIRHAFSKDLPMRQALENGTSCRFALIEFEGEVGLKHLLASGVRMSGNGLSEAKLLSPSVVLWHPEEGSIMNAFLEKWALKVGGCSSNHQAPSIPTFWEEYRSLTPEMGHSGVCDTIVGSGGALVMGSSIDLDTMIMEEAAKAGGLLGSSVDREGRGTPSEYGGRRHLRSAEEERSSDPVSGYPDRIVVDSGYLSAWSGNSANKGSGGGREKRKLEKSAIDEEEGEILEDRAEKRAKV